MRPLRKSSLGTRGKSKTLWANGKHNYHSAFGKTCAVKWKNLPHENAGRSAISERFWSVGQSNSFGKPEARRNYLIGKFQRLGSRMGITDDSLSRSKGRGNKTGLRLSGEGSNRWKN